MRIDEFKQKHIEQVIHTPENEYSHNALTQMLLIANFIQFPEILKMFNRADLENDQENHFIKSIYSQLGDLEKLPYSDDLSKLIFEKVNLHQSKLKMVDFVFDTISFDTTGSLYVQGSNPIISHFRYESGLDLTKIDQIQVSFPEDSPKFRIKNIIPNGHYNLLIDDSNKSLIHYLSRKCITFIPEIEGINCGCNSEDNSVFYVGCSNGNIYSISIDSSGIIQTNILLNEPYPIQNIFAYKSELYYFTREKKYLKKISLEHYSKPERLFNFIQLSGIMIISNYLFLYLKRGAVLRVNLDNIDEPIVPICLSEEKIDQSISDVFFTSNAASETSKLIFSDKNALTFIKNSKANNFKQNFKIPLNRQNEGLITRNEILYRILSRDEDLFFYYHNTKDSSIYIGCHENKAEIKCPSIIDKYEIVLGLESIIFFFKNDSTVYELLLPNLEENLERLKDESFRIDIELDSPDHEFNRFKIWCDEVCNFSVVKRYLFSSGVLCIVKNSKKNELILLLENGDLISYGKENKKFSLIKKIDTSTFIDAYCSSSNKNMLIIVKDYEATIIDLINHNELQNIIFKNHSKLNMFFLHDLNNWTAIESHDDCVLIRESLLRYYPNRDFSKFKPNLIAFNNELKLFALMSNSGICIYEYFSNQPTLIIPLLESIQNVTRIYWLKNNKYLLIFDKVKGTYTVDILGYLILQSGIRLASFQEEWLKTLSYRNKKMESYIKLLIDFIKANYSNFDPQYEIDIPNESRRDFKIPDKDNTSVAENYGNDEFENIRGGFDF